MMRVTTVASPQRSSRLLRRVGHALACLLFAATAPALAAEAALPAPRGHYVFRSYGPTEGLVNTAVTALLQDSHGFIWAGTDDGLFRYDGYRFAMVGPEYGLRTSMVDALHTDRAGMLWVATRSELSRWDGTAFVAAPGALAPDEIVHAMADDAAGLWLATTRGLRVAGADQRFHVPDGWPGGEATALLITPAPAALWVARWDGRAPQILRYADGLWSVQALPAGAPAQRVAALAEDEHGDVWARSADDLWRYDAGKGVFRAEDTPAPLSSTEQHGYISVGQHGDLWISTNDLLLHRNHAGWIETLGGPVLGTRPVLEDREGSVWFGARGLQRLAGRGVFHAYDVTEGLPGNVVWAIKRDAAQSLWVGTEHGAARAVGERFQALAGTQDYTIRTIAAAADGRVFFGGYPTRDVLVYDTLHGTLQHAPLGAGNVPGKILHLLIDRRGVLWATTDTAGLLHADLRDPELRFTREHLPGEAPGEMVRGIAEDRAGRLWIAGHEGLALREGERWRRLTTKDGLLRDDTRYVRALDDGDLLVAYDGTSGFDRMHFDAGHLQTLHHFAAGSRRYIDEIFLLGEDAAHNVWSGTGRGMDLYGADGENEHFSAQQGLLGEDTASMAFLADPNGDVWFGVVGGLMRFDAAKYRAVPHAIAPPTALLEVSLGERRFAPWASPLRVPHTDNSFQVRFASPSFVSEGTRQYRTQLDGLETEPAIGESHEARYPALPPGQYRFEVSARSGAHGAWGPPTTFSFSVLPAWWQTWWARLAFALALLCAVALAVRWRLIALERRTHELEQRIAVRTAELSEANRKLLAEIDERLNAERAVQQRNSELEELNGRLAGAQSQLLQSEKMASVGQLAAGVAHEINNPIGFVQSNLRTLTDYLADFFRVVQQYQQVEALLPAQHPQVLQLQALKRQTDLVFLRSDTDDLLAETLDGVTRVQKIVRDLKDFSHVDAAEWQTIDLHHSLDSTLNVVTHELKYKAELVKEYGKLPPIECLPFQINQVFLNLLVNAVQAIETHGTITLRTGCDGDFVWASIGDTGKGIAPAVMHRIFEPFFTTKPVGVGTGLGLSVSYGIIEKHGGRIDVESEVGRGTTFTVRLPIRSRKDATEPRQALAGSG